MGDNKGTENPYRSSLCRCIDLLSIVFYYNGVEAYPKHFPLKTSLDLSIVHLFKIISNCIRLCTSSRNRPH